MLPGITERQEKYARDICSVLSPSVDVRFPGAARDAGDIERIIQDFSSQGVDGILIVNLTYGPGLRLVNAFRDITTPLLLANVQPEVEVTTAWDMSDLTYNQGIHGAQDTANCLLRLGKQFEVYTGNWRSDEFRDVVTTFATAARTRAVLRKARIALFGQMPGMGDILTDPHSFMRLLGPQIDHLAMGLIVEARQRATAAQIDEVLAYCRENFVIDPRLTDAALQDAASLQVAIKTVLDEGHYDGFSIYFNQIAHDGRFRQTHMMAASNLMAEGYGYAAEGDSSCVSLMVAGHQIAPNAHFTEMYAMDFKRNALLQSHMGEGNWRIARKDAPVRLIDRPLGIGGLDNPPTVLFQGEPGPATLVSLVSAGGDHYRLVVAQGDILDSEVLPTVEMPYFFFRPQTGVQSCLNGWLKAGGTHHQVLHLGDTRRRWASFCNMTGIEYVEV
jgi:L-arabinose isomerase